MASAHDPDVGADDTDEGVAGMSDDESTYSTRSSIYRFVKQYGRSYHAYKDGAYHRPNDETELERLNLWDAIFKLVNNGKLYLSPLPPNAALRVLDIGAGTGSWAIEMADAHESADIIGIDLSPSMPSLTPPNVKFEITDVEDDWTFKAPFTFIHSRYMAASIKDWPRLMSKSLNNLQPGGWAEFIDFDIDYYSQDGSLSEKHALRRWITTAHSAISMAGREMNPGKHLEQWMKDAGFVNVQMIKTPLPIGTWPKDLRLKEIGVLNRTQLWEGLPGLSYRMFIDVLGWSRDDLENLLNEVRENLKDRKIHAMFDLYTVWGQRPSLLDY